MVYFLNNLKYFGTDNYFTKVINIKTESVTQLKKDVA